MTEIILFFTCFLTSGIFIESLLPCQHVSIIRLLLVEFEMSSPKENVFNQGWSLNGALFVKDPSSGYLGRNTSEPENWHVCCHRPLVAGSVLCLAAGACSNLYMLADECGF